MKLYELDQEIADMEKLLDTHLKETQGDLDEFEYKEHYEKLKGEREHKLLNLGAWHLNVEADITACTNQIEKLTKRRKHAINKAKWLSGFIRSFLSPSERMKDGRVQLSWRKSEGLKYGDSFDSRKLPIVFQRITYEVNRSDLKAAIKNGETFEGVSLEQRENLQIK